MSDNEIDISEMLEIMKKANNDHNISEDLMNEYESTCNEYIDYFKSILESIEKERKYIKKKKAEEERKKREEEERKKREEEERILKEREAVAALALSTIVPNITSSNSNLKKSVHINDIIHQILNVKQIEILERVKRRSLDDQMYFVDFEKNSRTDNAKYKALMGTFTILGTLNKQGVRSEYKVDLFNPEVYGSDKKIFNCDCPAHRFKSSQDNTVCKHISFIMCRVVGYATVDFFKTFTLNKDEVAMIMDKMSVQREAIMMNVEANRMKDSCTAVDNSLIIRKKILNKDSYLNSTRDVCEEDCPICFDVIEKDNNRLNCPDCKKHIHKECMEIWLSRNNSCVHCRSDKWKHYKKCFVENKSIELLD
jgi:hypothetical protein